MQADQSTLPFELPVVLVTVLPAIVIQVKPEALAPPAMNMPLPPYWLTLLPVIVGPAIKVCPTAVFCTRMPSVMLTVSLPPTQRRAH